MKHLTSFCYWIVGSFLGFGLIVGCSKDSSKTPQAPTEELMTRIGSLEEENKKLKAENSDLKARLGIADNQKETNQTQEISQQEKNPTPAQGGKMIGGTPKGSGDITLRGPGGEGEKITLILDPKISATDFSINLSNMEVDGNEPTKIYVDGQENQITQISKDMQSDLSIFISGKQIKKGIHNVEVIQEINGQQNFYRLLTYEVK